MKSRYWSIRSKIIALVVVPLTALLALWVFATVLTVGPAFNLLSAQTLLDTVGRPGEVLVGELQKERRLAVIQLSGEGNAVTPALAAQRAATDRAAADFRRSAGGEDAENAASDTLRTRIDQVFADLDGLRANRAHIDAREVDVVGAQNLFNGMIDAGFLMFSATASFGDDTVDRQIRALITVGRGQEYLSRADALLAAGNTRGRFEADVHDDLVAAIVTSRFLLAEGIADLPSSDRTTYQVLSNSASWKKLEEMQYTLLNRARPDGAPPVADEVWKPVYDTGAQQLRAFEINATQALAERSTPVAVRVLVRLGVAGLLGLGALVISIIVSIRVGRSIVGRLGRLRKEALELAGERLPSVVRRLQRGEPVDVGIETPPLEYGRDEIGQLGRAFNEVQTTAVQSAVDEAAVRKGLNEVFLNIARRSQTLLHRQLAMLDKMERRETEPDELEDLYRVDHLATRMRRHAEDLVILTGAVPGRGWRQPVAVIDVIRGAISEVEDYKRVDITTVAGAAVVGRAVGDVIHLLAELLENAASFSPPQTRVQVTGNLLPNGYALEIEDRGLGMSQESLDEANHKMIEPPDFDPSDSARLGLFVVARLAHRHGIKVSLRPSAYSGIVAVVLVPGELITAEPTPPGLMPPAPVAGATAWEHPAAALQWEDVEATQPVPLQSPGPVVPRQRGASEPISSAGPPFSSSSVADGLSPEGLVRRRRKARPAADEPAAAPPGETTREGLPKRVRQANLAPQLREAAPEDDADTVPTRSPDEIRSMMSALQRGSTRGRQAAAGIDPEPRPPALDNALDEAATVNLPVVRDEKDA
ncbi:nitrate- and nitrite sensing domain-containing protein [Actinoplanes sp. NPDC051470]|uniref:sensor histidine kinase n=1 Tax=unclassified Actinoplanes TaxID=2626549 RepID=UPI0034275BD6